MFHLLDMPVAIDTFIVRTIGDETIIMAEDGNDVHVLDEVGSFIWQSIDGKRSIQAILDAITSAYEVSPEVAKKDLLTFLDELSRKNIIKIQANDQ